MGNHFHLAVWAPKDGDLSDYMMWLLTAHVRRYHQHYHSSGHVWQGRAPRGLMFLFFMIILGWASTHIMPGNATFFGRHIGGFFVYGISVIDAYKWSRVKWETWKHAHSRGEP